MFGPNFVENLPSNLYIDSLLQLVGIQNGNGQVSKNPGTPPATPTVAGPNQNVDLFAAGTRCVHCKSVCDNFDITQCDHCKLVNKEPLSFFAFVFTLLLLFTDAKNVFRNSAAYVGHSIWKICGSNLNLL